ncbi:hypothetical protein B7463_g11670, partial [Scytalidium lignicola]
MLYHESDPGILHNIYTSPLAPYTVPGPALIAGASSSVPQSSSKVTQPRAARLSLGKLRLLQPARLRLPSGAAVVVQHQRRPQPDPQH